jgi:hypothetical protein
VGGLHFGEVSFMNSWFASLSVRPSTESNFQPLSSASPVTVEGENLKSKHEEHAIHNVILKSQARRSICLPQARMSRRIQGLSCCSLVRSPGADKGLKYC